MDPNQNRRELSILFGTIEYLARHLDIQKQAVLHSTGGDRGHVAVGDIGNNTCLQVIV